MISRAGNRMIIVLDGTITVIIPDVNDTAVINRDPTETMEKHPRTDTRIVHKTKIPTSRSNRVEVTRISKTELGKGK